MRSRSRMRECIARCDSYCRSFAKLPGLSPRNPDLPAVIELDVQLTVLTKIHAANEFQVDDLLPVGAKKALRIKLALECRERAPQQRPLLSPVQADVVAFRTEHADFAQG